jgi:hypothetical protein
LHSLLNKAFKIKQIAPLLREPLPLT